MLIGRSWRFAPRAVPTIAAAAFVALAVFLGRWQAHRAEEKQAIQDLYESRMAEAPVRLTGPVDSADPLLFRRVHAAGRWIGTGQVFIDNQILRGQAGFEVLAPLRIAGSDGAVLVNRGWVARSPDYPKPPAVAAPEGDAEVAGLATLPPTRFLELSTEVISGNVFQNLSIERYRHWSGLPVLPVVILADKPGPGLAGLEARPDTNPARHREYEVQWFLMAATALALWVGLNFKRVR